MLINLYFPKNCIFSKRLLWTYPRLFPNSGQKFFGWNAQNHLQKSGNDKTTLSFFVKKFTTQMSLWNGRVQFRQHCGKLLAKSMKKLCSEFRSERTHSFWSSSTSKCFSSHSEYTIDNPAFESTGKNEKKIVQKPRKPKKPIFEGESGNLLVETQNAPGKTSQKSFCQNPRTINRVPEKIKTISFSKKICVLLKKMLGTRKEKICRNLGKSFAKSTKTLLKVQKNWKTNL